MVICCWGKIFGCHLMKKPLTNWGGGNALGVDGWVGRMLFNNKKRWASGLELGFVLLLGFGKSNPERGDDDFTTDFGKL